MRAYLSLRMGHTPTTYALDESGSIPFCVSQQILKLYDTSKLDATRQSFCPTCKTNEFGFLFLKK